MSTNSTSDHGAQGQSDRPSISQQPSLGTEGTSTAEVATANMRLRVMPLPRDQFVIVLDRVGDMTTPEELSQLLIEHLGGCGGVLAFSEAVELDAWYQYG